MSDDRFGHQRTEIARVGRARVSLMLTDIVGYSARMSADEARAVNELEKHNRVVQGVVNANHGRTVKTIGDAFMVEFSEARDALACAIAVHRELERAFTGPDPLRVRIGLHFAEVEVIGPDLIGDGVNTLARIEPLAKPGGICASREFIGQLGQSTVPFASLGQVKVKNIARPLELFAWPPPPGEEEPATQVGRPDGRVHDSGLGSAPGSLFRHDEDEPATQVTQAVRAEPRTEAVPLEDPLNSLFSRPSAGAPVDALFQSGAFPTGPVEPEARLETSGEMRLRRLAELAESERSPARAPQRTRTAEKPDPVAAASTGEVGHPGEAAVRALDADDPPPDPEATPSTESVLRRRHDPTAVEGPEEPTETSDAIQVRPPRPPPPQPDLPRGLLIGLGVGGLVVLGLLIAVLVRKPKPAQTETVLVQAPVAPPPAPAPAPAPPPPAPVAQPAPVKPPEPPPAPRPPPAPVRSEVDQLVDAAKAHLKAKKNLKPKDKAKLSAGLDKLAARARAAKKPKDKKAALAALKGFIKKNRL